MTGQGRDSKFTKARKEAILETIKEGGGSVLDAAGMADVAPKTIYRWLEEGRQGLTKSKRDFYLAFHKARAERRSRAYSAIRKAAEGYTKKKTKRILLTDRNGNPVRGPNGQNLFRVEIEEIEKFDWRAARYLDQREEAGFQFKDISRLEPEETKQVKESPITRIYRFLHEAEQLELGKVTEGPLLTPRWTPLIPHEEQIRLITSPARFKTVPAGRRSGKTERAKRFVVRKALEVTRWQDPKYLLGAPTRPQAKRLFWDDIRALIPEEFIERVDKTDLMIKLVNGGEIWVAGLDEPARVEGVGWNGVVLDEYANIKKKTWTHHVRPALSDRSGWGWLIGVPEGRNHYYQTHQEAVSCTTDEWDGFTWESADILSPEEVESARKDLDELTFAQEYQASFVSFQGLAYYAFDRGTHCRPLPYDDQKPLILCFDFNVSPGVAVIAQEMALPSGQSGTGIIGEVHIPRHSNTPRVCKRILKDWGKHKGPVFLHGDASGGNASTSGVSGSDWDLIDNEFRNKWSGGLYSQVKRANPPVRSRINAVNSRLMNTLGEVRLMIDPDRAPKTAEDFDSVCVLEGGSGELDKSDKEHTHWTDALGYYLESTYPIRGNTEPLTISGWS